MGNDQNRVLRDYELTEAFLSTFDDEWEAYLVESPVMVSCACCGALTAISERAFGEDLCEKCFVWAQGYAGGVEGLELEWVPLAPARALKEALSLWLTDTELAC